MGSFSAAAAATFYRGDAVRDAVRDAARDARILKQQYILYNNSNNY